jgi:hypothetical protein
MIYFYHTLLKRIYATNDKVLTKSTTRFSPSARALCKTTVEIWMMNTTSWPREWVELYKPLHLHHLNTESDARTEAFKDIEIKVMDFRVQMLD